MSLVAGSALVITPVNCLISARPPPLPARASSSGPGFYTRRARANTPHKYTREPWHRAKHAKPAIKFLEHVPSCKYAVRVLVFETHFTYLVSSPACLEAVPLDRKWKRERYSQDFYPQRFILNEISIEFGLARNYIFSFIFSADSFHDVNTGISKIIGRIIDKLALKWRRSYPS